MSGYFSWFDPYIFLDNINKNKIKIKTYYSKLNMFARGFYLSF